VFLFSALVEGWFPSKSGLIHKHIVKHIVMFQRWSSRWMVGFPPLWSSDDYVL
jgi:hypothetical protein